jgi:hypothetical protein
VTTLEPFAAPGVVADRALLLLGVHPAKIPIPLAVGAAISTLLDALADGVNPREPEAGLKLCASHCLGPSALYLSLETLSV